MLLYILILLGIFYVSIILPIRTKNEVSRLSEKFNALQKMVASLTNEAKISKSDPNTGLTASAKLKASEMAESMPAHMQPAKKTYAAEKVTSTTATVPTKKISAGTDSKNFNLEQQIGTRLPVWIGSIALAFAGFYMIKYSIEAGLLSPAVRLIISSIFGLVLIATSYYIRSIPKFANGTRIIQALAGSGIAVLYFSAYAATNLYSFIPDILGFAAMAAITALCIVMSLSLGEPIALIGLVGGFLSPALLKQHPDTGLLFLYLYVLLLGMFYIVKKYNCWWLGTLAIIAAFSYFVFWTMNYSSLYQSTWLALFLIALTSTFIWFTKNYAPPSLRLLALGGAFILMSLVIAQNNFQLHDWGMLAILVVGSIALAAKSFEIYKYYPAIALFTVISMLCVALRIEHVLLIIVAFAFIFVTLSYCLMWFQRQGTVYWAVMASASNFAFYILTYCQTLYWPNKQISLNNAWIGIDRDLMLNSEHMLGIIGAICAIFWSLTLAMGRNKLLDNKKNYQGFFATCVAAVTAFATVGLMLNLDIKFLTILLASELCVISWINTMVDVRQLKIICMVLAVTSLFSLLSQFMSHGQIMASPAIYMGIPAILFAIASFFLRDPQDTLLSNILEVAAIILLAIMGCCLISNESKILSHIPIDANFLESGLCNNYLILLGIFCIVILGQKFERIACKYSGFAVLTFALCYIILINVLFNNPVANKIAIGNIPIFNALLLPYGLPAIWLLLGQKGINNILGKLFDVRILAGALAFVWVTLNVRQIFHGTYLQQGETSNLEIYMYSIVWLSIALVLLGIGTIYKDRMIRVSSLLLMIITVSKVFLYDAAALTGLLRVFSFLGLGLSLIAISWFYARFVFDNK
jgi:uncharacterized membrane protein